MIKDIGNFMEKDLKNMKKRIAILKNGFKKAGDLETKIKIEGQIKFKENLLRKMRVHVFDIEDYLNDVKRDSGYPHNIIDLCKLYKSAYKQFLI